VVDAQLDLKIWQAWQRGCRFQARASGLIAA